MKRSNTGSLTGPEDLATYKQTVAYHEAGHAIAICLNNKQKDLPPVFFKIVFTNIDEWPINNLLKDQVGEYGCIASVVGGRLIQSLLHMDDCFDQKSTCNDKHAPLFSNDYLLAFEADIVNLLIGPLAEAKYTAQIDSEPFSLQLLSVQALKNYGGDADLKVVNEYLQSFSTDKQVQNESLNPFFIRAFNFVNDDQNWMAISRLANYILVSKKNRISSYEVEEIIGSQ